MISSTTLQLMLVKFSKSEKSSLRRGREVKVLVPTDGGCQEFTEKILFHENSIEFSNFHAILMHCLFFEVSKRGKT